tara:strand:- start:2194 stop:2412 length:219 start_codon:yes stop_codon:yes gene_type:complete
VDDDKYYMYCDFQRRQNCNVKKADLIHLSPIDKSGKIFLGNIKTTKSRDKTSMKEEFMKYFGLNALNITTKR